MDKDIPYFAVNVPVDMCEDCGYSDEINDTCPECGGHLVQRNGRYGSFYGCSNYPKCRYTIK